MKANMLMWSLCVSGAYTLGWNWGWGYYRTFKINKMDGFGGYIGHYKYQKGDLALITDPIHLSNRNQISVDQAKRIRDANKKVVYMCYESLNLNDFPIGGKGLRSYRDKVEANPNWRAMMENSDLLVVADPHDKWALENNPNPKNIKYPKIVYLPLAVDHRLFVPQKPYVNKACFIGNMVAHRIRYLKPIPKTIIDYPKTVNGGSTYLAKLKDTQNYVAILGKYAVNLNIRTLFSGLQLRIFETMALGRVCVSHKPTDAQGRVDLWKDLENVVWYDNSFANPNQKKIIATIQNVLKDRKRAAAIGAAAREEIVQKHTHDIRVNQIMKELGL